jgi:hypothetical protein
MEHKTMNNTGIALGGLDITFDYLVSLMAPKNVLLTSSQYADFEAMRADYEATGFLKINTDFSDHTIFGSKTVNWQFRAWHDLCHILENADFSRAGEIKAMSRQIEQVYALYEDGRISREDYYRFGAIIETEVKGQFDYLVDHGTFPVDQREFTKDYLYDNFGMVSNTFPKTLDGFTIAY